MASDGAPTDLRCNYLVGPLAIREGPPTFSWSTEADSGVGRQRSYQLLVATDELSLDRHEGSAWDSGRRDGTTAGDVRYEGQTLEPLGRYFWKVRIWTASDTPSPWSAVATFEVGIGGTEQWTASWVSWDDQALAFEPATERGPVDQVQMGLAPVPYVRREFDVAGGLSSARLYVTARGLYEIRLNGKRVGDGVLAPGWTDYAVRIQYQAHDVTEMLEPGTNAMGALVGDGWYSGYFGFQPKRSGAHYGDHPELLAQLHLRYLDGTSEWIVTDRSWKANWGAILHADPLMGELLYPGLHPVGWDEAGFDDRRWYPVAARPHDQAAAIVADPGPAIRVTEELTPRSIVPVEDGGFVIDFGQNLTGWIRLVVDGAGGETIRIRHGEMLDTDGRLYVDNLRTARQTDEFWTSGGPEVFEPHFTWHGFRYVEVAGHPGPLTSEDVTACVVHSDIEVTGVFECSDPVVNQLHANIDWSLRGNFLSVPTDCPQRDERLGWLGDAQVFARTATYVRDVLTFFDKWLDDVMDAQLDSGAFTDMAPSLGLPWFGAPAWGDAGVIIPWTLFKMYGSLGPTARCYGAMSRWMEFISAGNPDQLRTRELGNDYGDWLAPDGDATPHELLATAYWAYDATLMSDLATALGREADAAHYHQLAGEIARAFATEFVGDDGEVGTNTQTGYALALFMNLVPSHLRARAADHLVDAISARQWHLSTGFVGVGYLLPVLSGHGYSDVAYRLLDQETLPSWRYPIRQGATTIWERWDGWTEESGFQSPHMNSFNHYSLGSVGEWLYRFVVGIDQPTDHVGFECAQLRPHPGASMSWAGAVFHSRRGPIGSTWRRHRDSLTLDVSIPPNVTASIHVPSTDPAGVRDQRDDGPDAVGEFCGRRGMHEAIFEVGPGTYRYVGEYAVPEPVDGDVGGR
jgi:alpha-L-rhamnosidase